MAMPITQRSSRRRILLPILGLIALAAGGALIMLKVGASAVNAAPPRTVQLQPDGKAAGGANTIKPSDVEARHPIARVEMPDNATLKNPNGMTRLLQAPDSAAAAVASLPDGQRLFILGRRGDWTQIYLQDGREGYVPTALVLKDS